MLRMWYAIMKGWNSLACEENKTAHVPWGVFENQWETDRTKPVIPTLRRLVSWLFSSSWGVTPCAWCRNSTTAVTSTNRIVSLKPGSMEQRSLNFEVESSSIRWPIWSKLLFIGEYCLNERLKVVVELPEFQLENYPISNIYQTNDFSQFFLIMFLSANYYTTY